MFAHPAGAYPLLAEVPSGIRQQIEGSVWDHARMRGLDLPVRALSVEALRWHLELPFWRDGDRLFAVCPVKVRAAPERFAEQYRRTMAADLRYPLIVLDVPGRPLILDGLHRLLKADMGGHTDIAARLLAPERLPEIFVEKLSSPAPWRRPAGRTRNQEPRYRAERRRRRTTRRP